MFSYLPHLFQTAKKLCLELMEICWNILSEEKLLDLIEIHDDQ